MIRVLLAAAALFLAGPAVAQTPPAAPGEQTRWLPPASAAVLQTLDKITGRVRTVEAPVDETIRFGTLDIVARVCRKRPPEETPESAALLEIRDSKPGEAAQSLFTGWMFASSPAVSALEHPVYDVWVIDCKIDGEAKSGAP